MRQPTGPLVGLRVLDLGTRIGAPFAATLLSDLGADVIKVELPGQGDFMRTIGPFDRGHSLFWAVEGRGKRSVTLDLRKPAGQALLKRLVPLADVVVENFQPGTLESWGLGYEVLAALNPGIILTRVSVYGQDGPYRDRPGLDRNGIAMGGLMYITGYPDRPPVRPGLIVSDYLTGVFNAFAILSAIYERDRRARETGTVPRGQWVDLSLYQSILRIMEHTLASYDRLGVVREREGNRLTNSAPLDNWETADGKYICIIAAGDGLFPRLCCAMGREDLVADPRFASMALRAQHGDEINAVVAAWCRQRTARTRCRSGSRTRSPTSSSIPTSRRAATSRPSTIRSSGRCACRASTRASRARPARSAAGRRSSVRTTTRCTASCSACPSTSGPRCDATGSSEHPSGEVRIVTGTDELLRDAEILARGRETPGPLVETARRPRTRVLTTVACLLAVATAVLAYAMVYPVRWDGPGIVGAIALFFPLHVLVVTLVAALLLRRARRRQARLAGVALRLVIILTVAMALIPSVALWRRARELGVPVSLGTYLANAAHLNVGVPQPERSVAYGTAPDGTKLELDVWRSGQPDDGPLRPAMVYVHGGAWSHGTRGMQPDWNRWLNGLGYEVFDVEYRLAPPVRWLDEIGDVKAALGWV